MQSHLVRLESGVIGTLVTSLKPRELLGRLVMCQFDRDGDLVKESGRVAHVYEQLNLELEK